MVDSWGRGYQLSARGVLTNQKPGSIALLVYGLLLVVTGLWLAVERLLNCVKEKEFWTVIIVLDQRGVLIKLVFIWLQMCEQSLPPLWCHLCLSSTFCILVIRSQVRWIAFDILNKQGRAPQVKLRYWFWISFSFSVFKGVSKTVTLKTFNLG